MYVSRQYEVERDEERKRERRKTTYQTPVMQIRIYTGDLRGLICGGFRGPGPSRRRPRAGDAAPDQQLIQNYIQSTDPGGLRVDVFF